MGGLTSWSRSAIGKRTRVELRVCGGNGSAFVSVRSKSRIPQYVGRKNISATHPRRQRGGYLPDELSRVCETKVAPNKWTSADQQRTDDSAGQDTPSRQSGGSDQAASDGKPDEVNDRTTDRTASQPARRTRSDRSTAAKVPAAALHPAQMPRHRPATKTLPRCDAQRQCSRQSEAQGSKEDLYRNARRRGVR